MCEDREQTKRLVSALFANLHLRAIDATTNEREYSGARKRTVNSFRARAHKKRLAKRPKCVSLCGCVGGRIERAAARSRPVVARSTGQRYFRARALSDLICMIDSAAVAAAAAAAIAASKAYSSRPAATRRRRSTAKRTMAYKGRQRHICVSMLVNQRLLRLALLAHVCRYNVVVSRFFAAPNRARPTLARPFLPRRLCCGALLLDLAKLGGTIDDAA